LSNASKSPELPRATVSNPRSQQGHKPHRRRLTNYLLNKSLQLRYITFVTVLSAVISGALGYLIWEQETLASSKILESVEAMCDDGAQDCAELYADLGANLSAHDTSLVLRMGLIGIGLVVVLVLYLLIMTHKMAGPLYKVSLYFERMTEGRLGEVYPLRKGDMLTDFYDKFKAMHDAVRSRHKQENELFGRFVQACDAAGVDRQGELGEKLDELENFHKEREQALA
jgi:hypothetical protein